MKKRVIIDKQIQFPTMIGEITAISLEKELSFVDSNNVEGNLYVKGKYKLTEASRLEEDFYYKIPTEIVLSEKIKLENAQIEIMDFSYQIENQDTMICHIELLIEGEEVEEMLEDRECDGDSSDKKEIEIPSIAEEIVTVDDNTSNDSATLDEENNDNEVLHESVFPELNENDTEYGTFLVYNVRGNETIQSIIEKYHTTLEEVEKYNDIKDLSVGTKIIIPLIDD